MAKSVVVTGAHGFLGRHVARQFAEASYAVTGIGHGTWDYDEFSRFGLTFWHSADITVDSLVTYAGKPDVIIHCAGSGSVAFSMEHPHQDFVRTVANTAAVLEFVRLHAPNAVVVYPSSAAVYGAVDKVPIQESDPMRPASPYGAHKVMAEDLCRSYAANFSTAVAIVRFFSIYGKGLKKQLLWDACRKMTAVELTFHGTGQEIRDWLHVRDAASLLLHAANNASPSCLLINGGSGTGVANAALLQKVLAQLGAPGQLTFNGVGRSGDPSRYVADTQRAAMLGWAPKVALDDGIQDYVKWFQGLRHP